MGPRELTLDITPFAPLLTGTKYVGVEIGHYVQKGWWVTVDFVFTERPDLASAKPPADVSKLARGHSSTGHFSSHRLLNAFG